MSDLEFLRKRIAEEEARLARVEKERDEALAKLQELKDRLAVEDSAPIPPKPVPSDSLPFPSKTPSTHAEKVVLFRSLFRGRKDVFPRLWEKTKTGRKGYSPVCSNEWVRGICEKPRIKCGKCSHRAFLPVTDQVVLDHLQGRHVIGVESTPETAERRRQSAGRFVLIGMPDFIRKHSSRLRDPLRSGPCGEKSVAEGRERSTEEVTRPQAGLEDSVIWLDFHLTGWFEFIESGAP